MTKEEKIKEEYLKLGLPFNENIIFDNGWLKIKPGLYSSKYDDLDLLKLTNHVHSIRPKSLSGIENNNNWIKLDTKSDLPKETGQYLTRRANGIIITEWFYNNNLSWYLWKDCYSITHCQPIIKPREPLY